MHRRVVADDINLFSDHARIIVCGSSSSGKSFMVSKLIRKYRSQFENVILIGANLENIEDLHVIRNDDFNPVIDELNGRTLVIFDDIILNKKKLLIASESFIRSRHMKVSLVLLTQNLNLADPSYRIISLNSTHVIIFRNRDVKQISCFARSFLENDEVKIFVELYKKTVLNVRHGYLLVDFTKNSGDPLNIRTNIVDEGYERAFKLTN